MAHNNSTNLFSSLKIVIFISKICGTFSFSVKGHCGSRRLVITKTDKARIVIQIVLMVLVLTGYFVEQKPIDEFRDSLTDNSFFNLIILINITLFILLPVIFNIFQHKSIFKVLINYEKLIVYFESINVPFNYKSLIIKLRLILVLQWCLWFIYILTDIHFVEFKVTHFEIVFYIFSSLIAISVEIQMIVLVLVGVMLVQTINQLLKMTTNDNDIKNFMQVHYDVYLICLQICKSFHILIVGYFNGFYVVAISAFLIVEIIQNGEYSTLGIIDTFCWCLANNFSVILITYYCWRVTFEVCVTSIIHCKDYNTFLLYLFYKIVNISSSKRHREEVDVSFNNEIKQN